MIRDYGRGFLGCAKDHVSYLQLFGQPGVGKRVIVDILVTKSLICVRLPTYGLKLVAIA
jgi:hypothetical protein